MFDDFLNNEAVNNFIVNYRNIDANNKFCRGNILGLNVNNLGDILSRKFYFSTSFILNKDQILKFLPTEEDLIEVYIGASWNQGDTYRLENCEAIWNGTDLEIQYDPRTNRSDFMG